MARDNVTFRFNIDLSQMTVKGRQAIKILEELEKKSGGASQGFTRLKGSSDQVGQSLAANAVNFQTATTGMLNLSTAAVQTFTSISNLDRANNRAKMSIIAVARAQDLLNNKEQRLQEMRDSGIISGQKYANMQREIATATSDLVVKQEKQEIEQAAVNDIYMLFATNIANVTISSMQTIAILDKSDILLKKGRALGQKLLTLTTWQNVQASRAQALVQKENLITLAAMPGTAAAATLALKNMTFAQRMSTLSTRAGTMALHGLKIALGPIGLIFIGISAAMVAYDQNLGNMKDIINDLLGIQDDFEQNLLDQRDATDEATGATQRNLDTIGKVPSTYDKAKKAMQDYRNELISIASHQKHVNDAAKILESGVPLSLSDFQGGSPTPKTGFKEFLKFLSTFGQLPTAAAEPFIPKTVPEVFNKFGITPEITFGQGPGGFNVVTGIENEGLAFDFAHKEAMVESFEFRKREFERIEKEKQQKSRVQEIAKFGISSMIGTDLLLAGDRSKFDPARGDFLISNQPDKKLSKILGRDISAYEANLLYKKSLRGGIELTKKEREVVKTVREDIAGLDEEAGHDESKRLAKLNNRDFIQQALNTDIGAIANSIDRNEALRLAVLQKNITRDFTNTEGGKSGKIAQYLAQQGGMSKGTTDVLSGFVGSTRDQAFNIALGNGSISATAAYQVPRGSIATPKVILDANRNRMSFVNGIGAMIMNVVNKLTGGRQFSLNRSHVSMMKSRRFKHPEGADIITKAVDMGIRQAPEWMEMINEIPKVDLESSDNIKQASDALDMAKDISTQYISFRNSQMAAVGFTSSILDRANTAGYSGTGLYENIALLAATRRTNFSNTEIIDQSKSKLSLTNSQVFAIRFNSTRGDTELQDRFRYVDQLEAMASGTSPL